MTDIKLSIVVPVYNVEKYIVKCISSLLFSGRKDYEILVVNDGTKDRSIEIVKEKFMDTRIRVIEQKNAGLSAARNLGIKEARGEYIWFFDSDDWAETKDIPSIIDKLQDIDFLFFSSYYMNNENSKTQRIEGFKNVPKSIEELKCSQFFFCAPYYIFHRDFLLNNNLSFEVGLLHEDSLFTPIMITYAQTIKCYNNPVYHHRLRTGSITHSKISPKRLMDLMYIVRSLVDFGEKNVNPSIRWEWGACIARILNSVMFLAQQCEDKKIVAKLRDYVNSDYRLLNYMKKAGINNKIMRLLALFANNHLYDIYSILYRLRYNSLINNKCTCIFK